MDKIKILVIDAERTIGALLTDVLSDTGYKVKVVSSEEEGLVEIKKDGYSIVIIDLKIPGMNGIDVIKKLKQINSDICIIVITAYPSIKLAVEAIRAGAYDYIAKPFNIEEIKLILSRAVERSYLLKEAMEKKFYRELSILDGLTGVYNHRYFHEVILREIEQAKRYSQSFSLLMIDIDNFKKYNDTYGHLAGDKLLSAIANFLITIVRKIDMVFRYGGEEFIIFLPQVDKEKGVVVAERIRNLIKQKFPITLSIGIASFPEDGSSKEELIDKADSAMYQAKRLGKDKVCIFGVGEKFEK